jgi:hypothetical protein
MRVEKGRLEQQSKKGRTEKNEKSTQMVNLNRSIEFSLHSESKSLELANQISGTYRKVQSYFITS